MRAPHPVAATIVAIAALLALLFQSAPTTTPQAAAKHHVSVTTSDIHLVADDGSATECFEAAAAVYWGLVGKGLEIAVSLDKFKAFFTTVAGLIPGVGCGKYLGKKNVQVICWLTQRPWWFPNALYARGLVLFITGGQTNRCT